MFALNDAVDQAILRPTAIIYKEAVPALIQNDIKNVLRWLDIPNVLANNLLQGDLAQAQSTLKYFVAQSASLGTLDIEQVYEIAFRDEDFGQTLGVYGIKGGPYLVLPLLGPTNVRDAVGRTVDVFLNPLTHLGPWAGRTVFKLTKGSLEALSFRAGYGDQIDELRSNSLDYYAKVKSIYEQRRNTSINNGKVSKDLPAADTMDAFDGQFLKLLEKVN